MYGSLGQVTYAGTSDVSQDHWFPTQSTSDTIPWTDRCLQDLHWWIRDVNLFRGSPLHPPVPQVQIFTDASHEGWGAHMGMESVSGVWSRFLVTRHINFLELTAIQLALDHWQPQVCYAGFGQLCFGSVYTEARGGPSLADYLVWLATFCLRVISTRWRSELATFQVS